MRSLGDWLAKDVLTVAKVTEGDETLEDLGIEGLEPGQHIVKCTDVEPLRDAVSAELRELVADMYNLLTLTMQPSVVRDATLARMRTDLRELGIADWNRGSR